MRKTNYKILCVLLVAFIAAGLLLGLVACNKSNDKNKEINIEGGTRPEFASIISSEQQALIDSALLEDAAQADINAAVMALYEVANKSRKDTAVSLMVQNSDAGIDMGDVIMHGFNLRNGDAWYYQLAVEASSDNELMSAILAEVAGFLKVAYTTGDGVYKYVNILGSETECDVDVETFPYATFKLTRPLVDYNEEQFKEELHYYESMHEINNMVFCAEILKDNATLTYDAEKKLYTATFEVDTQNENQDLIKEWYKMAEADMAVSGNHIKKYNSYTATFEVWDNGYIKSFSSRSDRDAGMASGKPADDFVYFWNESEILALLSQTEVESDGVNISNMIDSVDDYIAYYSNKEAVAAKLGTMKIALIVVGSVLGVIAIAGIAYGIIKAVVKKRAKELLEMVG